MTKIFRCGPLKTQFNISSPVKSVDMGLYGGVLSPVSKRKYGMSEGHGHQCAGTDMDMNGASEVSSKPKKLRRFDGQ